MKLTQIIIMIEIYLLKDYINRHTKIIKLKIYTSRLSHLK